MKQGVVHEVGEECYQRDLSGGHDETRSTPRRLLRSQSEGRGRRVEEASCIVHGRGPRSDADWLHGEQALGLGIAGLCR